MERLFGNGDDLVRELRYMESQMQVGVPVEQLFWNLGQRSGVEEIRNFGDIFLIARRSGGNLGKILGREDTGHRGDSGSDRRKEAGTAGDEYGSGSDDPLYAGDFPRISGCLIS